MCSIKDKSCSCPGTGSLEVIYVGPSGAQDQPHRCGGGAESRRETPDRFQPRLVAPSRTGDTVCKRVKLGEAHWNAPNAAGNEAIPEYGKYGEHERGGEWEWRRI